MAVASSLWHKNVPRSLLRVYTTWDRKFASGVRTLEYLAIQAMMHSMGAYPATEAGGGLGRAMPRCRHIGCVASHGAAAVSCCVRVIGTPVTYVTCAGRATTGKCAAARAVTWVSLIREAGPLKKCHNKHGTVRLE